MTLRFAYFYFYLKDKLNYFMRRNGVSYIGRAIAKEVSHRSLTADAQVRTPIRPCKICGRKSGTGQVFLEVLQFSPAKISFHRGFPFSYVTWEMINRPVCRRSSDTVSPHRHEQQQQQQLVTLSP